MNNKRILKNARLENVPVHQNNLYTFSSRYTLSIYPLDAICTFIPKNACSSLRFSIAIANGFIKDINDIRWMYLNNQTFISTQREIVRAMYTFVVLRCPYTRVASCFLDKFVGQRINYNDASGKKLSINFNEFLLIIKSQVRAERDEHWRNQSDFLHYENYDDYFSLELFSKAIDSLNNRGFKVYDTRQELKHNLSQYKRVSGDFSKMKDIDLKKMNDEGIAPDYESMFGIEEIELVKEIYNDDINLYKTLFGDSELLF